MSLNLNGQKKGKGKSSKDKIRELEQLVRSTNMALQMSQQMIKFLSERIGVLEQDIKSTQGVANELDYRTLSLVDLLEVNKDELDEIANNKKKETFNNASDKEDEERGYTEYDVVEEDSIIILTSTTPNLEDDAGIFRSKVALAEITQEDIKEGLLGKKVGDTVQGKIGEVDHEITVLGIRKPKVEAPADIVDEDLATEDNGNEVENEEQQT